MGSHSLRGSVDWNRFMLEQTPAGIAVTPFVGVWIEIMMFPCNTSKQQGHSLRGSVDWNCCDGSDFSPPLCHSLRGSVDWNHLYLVEVWWLWCHSLRGSVDWNAVDVTDRKIHLCHSLRGSVDWNSICRYIGNPGKRSLPSWECGLKSVKQTEEHIRNHVTPFVGVWIEMKKAWSTYNAAVVTPFVGVWIEIYPGIHLSKIAPSLPSWECGLKLPMEDISTMDVWSLPSWECGLKLRKIVDV